MTTDHGPQDDIRPLTPAEADEALKKAKNRNASEEEIDRIVEAVTRGELPKVTDHGPQRESVRDVLKRHGIDPNRMSENRDDLDILQPYAEDLMPDDHGPQRQPEREMSRSEISGELVEMWWLRDELARLRDEVDNLSRSRTQWRELAKSRTKMLGVQEAELAHLREELARLRAALKAVLEWYDRDGSVGGCDLLIEDVVRPLLAADALRGEGENDERTGT